MPNDCSLWQLIYSSWLVINDINISDFVSEHCCPILPRKDHLDVSGHRGHVYVLEIQPMVGYSESHFEV